MGTTIFYSDLQGGAEHIHVTSIYPVKTPVGCPGRDNRSSVPSPMHGICSLPGPTGGVLLVSLAAGSSLRPGSGRLYQQIQVERGGISKGFFLA